MSQEDTDCEEEQEQYYHDIEDLQKFGINAADIAKLKAAGLCTVRSVLQL